MIAYQAELRVGTRGSALIDITDQVSQIVEQSGVDVGLCTVFVQHTSASLVIQENADPTVRHDLRRWFAELAPESRAWEHDMEGADDMPAHARSAITRTSESIPVTRGRLALGTWQALYLWEHRGLAHVRHVVVHVQGTGDESGGRSSP
jgi:secondary thiamine-phosphate synthase enzyme